MKTIKPIVHWNETVTDKQTKRACYVAEISTNAGTHRLHLDKEQVDNEKIQVANPRFSPN